MSGKNRSPYPFLVALVVAIMLITAACAPAAPAAPQPTSASVPQPASASAPIKQAKVALVTFDVVADAGWNATAHKGLKNVEQKYGVKTALSENVPIPNMEATIREYCSQGYDLVVANSDLFAQGAMKVAPDFPACKIGINTGQVHAANVASYYPWEVQSHFLSGALAALMSKTGKIGVIGGMDLPNVRAKARAVEAGAKSIRPDIKVVTTYVGSFNDPAKGKEMAVALIGDGVDVLDHLAATSGLGVIEAAAEKNVWVINDVILDQTRAPKNMIAAHMLDHPAMIDYWVKEVLDGKFKDELYRPGLETGQIDLAMTDLVPADVQQKVKDIKQQIIDGKVKVEERFD